MKGSSGSNGDLRLLNTSQRPRPLILRDRPLPLHMTQIIQSHTVLPPPLLLTLISSVFSKRCSRSTPAPITHGSTLIARRFRFQPSADVSGQVNVKSSVQRSIRSSILSQWKINPETLEQVWPKKESLTLVKWSATSHPSIAGKR